MFFLAELSAASMRAQSALLVSFCSFHFSGAFEHAMPPPPLSDDVCDFLANGVGPRLIHRARVEVRGLVQGGEFEADVPIFRQSGSLRPTRLTCKQ